MANISPLDKLMQNNRQLNAELFDDNDALKNDAYDFLTGIVAFFIEEIKKIYNDIKVKDVVISGGMASYHYNETSDIDLIIVLDIAPQDYELFKWHQRYLTISKKKLKNIFYWGKHEVDYLMMSEYQGDVRQYAYCEYSLLYNRWNQKPVYREYSFSKEEANKQLREYLRQEDVFFSNLPRSDDGYLTISSCEILSEHMNDERDKAFENIFLTGEREYNLKYFIHRCFRNTQLFQNMSSFLKVSYQHQINII